MKWQCVFFHDWTLEAHQLLNIVEDENDKFPEKFTRFLYRCKRCEEIKIKMVEGTWKIIEDEKDDDDNRDAPSAPILSPDDYYESISK